MKTINWYVVVSLPRVEYCDACPCHQSTDSFYSTVLHILLCVHALCYEAQCPPRLSGYKHIHSNVLQ